MKDKLPPKYDGIFQYMLENYQDLPKSSFREQFWVHDLEENQYPRLEGVPHSQRNLFGSPEGAFEAVRKYAFACGGDLFSTCLLNEVMIFEGADVRGKYVISIGMEMDLDDINTAPDPPAGIEALRVYWRLGWVVMKVAEFIRSLGYEAQGHQVRTFIKDPPTILHSVAAEFAGLGEFGRLGLLITREFGPRVRFGTITTDLPLPDTGKKRFGVDDFCSNCARCAQECNGDAIPMERSVVRGHEKYTIDPYKCLPEFAKYDGCGICIKVCPFNKRKDEMGPFSNQI